MSDFPHFQAKQATLVQTELNSVPAHLDQPDRKARLDRLETMAPTDHQEMPDQMQQEG